MKVPKDYTGQLLLDDGQRPAVKLNHEQRSILKQLVTILTPIIGKSVAKSASTAKLITTLIVLLEIDQSSPKSIHLLFNHVRFFQLAQTGKLVSSIGTFKHTQKEIPLIGMDNYLKTTCYLNSLIFAMFATTSIYDFLLDPFKDPNLSDPLQNDVEELKIILRFIINLLRAGHHIHVNIIYQLLLVLNSLGCDIALSETQQDSLQMFIFLVECLSLPLLTFKLAIIHEGKLNVADDLKLIEERALLLSVPSNGAPDEPAIDFQECLDKYFNNSITVRRHMDRKNTSISNAVQIPDESEEVILPPIHNFNTDDSEMDEYKKKGILQSVGLNFQSNGDVSDSSTPVPLSKTDYPVEDVHSLRSTETNVSPVSTISIARGSAGSPIKTPPLDAILSFHSYPVESSASTSFKNVTEKLDRQRVRSSTVVSMLNNVSIPNASRITRRASSISNQEVALPAWMYMQVLPYYTDPDVKLTVENHEDYFRTRDLRSKTIDSSEPSVADIPAFKKELSSFERRYGSHRPVIPICLKRYSWDEKGQSIKIKRTVNIPEIIMYPFFIAEDRTKFGYVDFKRNSDFKAPCGSFMLVLQGCVCHRGANVNSGHYISITRKRKYNPNGVNKDEWILFNDMESNTEKVKTYSFKEIMEKEEPYILFYEIVPLNNTDDLILSPQSFNEDVWKRKPSTVSDISEGTIVDYSSQNSHVDESRASSLMHLNLGSLTKSKSKNNEFEDVLEEYHWDDDEPKGAHSVQTVIQENASRESEILYYQKEPSIGDYELNGPRIMVTEITDSSLSTTIDGTSNGVLEYEVDPFTKPEFGDPSSKDNEIISMKSHTSHQSKLNAHANKDSSREDSHRKKKSTIGKLFKKVFN